MFARLSRNNPTSISFTIYSTLVASYKFRQEEEEKEVLLHEYTTKISTVSFRDLDRC
jgi:hypothetical protein